jgi:signal transduction histidine kinase
MMKDLLKKWFPYSVAFVVFILVAVIYALPALEGKVIISADSVQPKAAVQESMDYLEKTGNHTFWTNSMFGGMPNYQIGGGKTLSEKITAPVLKIMRWGHRNVIFILFFYFFAFFALMRAFGVNVWLSIAGTLLAITFGLMLFQLVKNSRKEQLLLSTKAVQEGEMEERARIAQDLHDRLGGSLAAMKMELKNTESMKIIKDKTDECINELREIVQDIMPYVLKQFGMKIALEDFCAQFPNLFFYFYGEDQRIESSLEYTVYCCAKELVINSLKHSDAKNINLQLVQNKNFISLTVQDNGCGFDEKTVKKGYGFKNINNRITSCKGKLDITSVQGEGTEVVIELLVDS